MKLLHVVPHDYFVHQHSLRRTCRLIIALGAHEYRVHELKYAVHTPDAGVNIEVLSIHDTYSAPLRLLNNFTS